MTYNIEWNIGNDAGGGETKWLLLKMFWKISILFQSFEDGHFPNLLNIFLPLHFAKSFWILVTCYNWLQTNKTGDWLPLARHLLAQYLPAPRMYDLNSSFAASRHTEGKNSFCICSTSFSHFRGNSNQYCTHSRRMRNHSLFLSPTFIESSIFY